MNVGGDLTNLWLWELWPLPSPTCTLELSGLLPVFNREKSNFNPSLPVLTCFCQRSPPIIFRGFIPVIRSAFFKIFKKRTLFRVSWLSFVLLLQDMYETEEAACTRKAKLLFDLSVFPCSSAYRPTHRAPGNFWRKIKSEI